MQLRGGLGAARIARMPSSGVRSGVFRRSSSLEPRIHSTGLSRVELTGQGAAVEPVCAASAQLAHKEGLGGWDWGKVESCGVRRSANLLSSA